MTHGLNIRVIVIKVISLLLPRALTPNIRCVRLNEK